MYRTAGEGKTRVVEGKRSYVLRVQSGIPNGQGPKNDRCHGKIESALLAVMDRSGKTEKWSLKRREILYPAVTLCFSLSTIKIDYIGGTDEEYYYPIARVDPSVLTRLRIYDYRNICFSPEYFYDYSSKDVSFNFWRIIEIFRQILVNI